MHFHFLSKSNVPVFICFNVLLETLVGHSVRSSCMRRDLPLTTERGQYDMKELVCHHFHFYARAALCTMGSLMILVSLRAREKRLSVKECKMLKIIHYDFRLG